MLHEQRQCILKGNGQQNRLDYLLKVNCFLSLSMNPSLECLPWLRSPSSLMLPANTSMKKKLSCVRNQSYVGNVF